MSKGAGTTRLTVSRLRSYFERNGCLRAPNRKRRKAEPEDYKKGYEIRFPAQSAAELREIRGLLRRVGVKLGSAYEKRSGYVQPVYGKQAVEQLCDTLGIDK